MLRRTIAKLSLAAALMPVTALATTNFWIGNNDGNYNDASRWLVHTVPSASDNLNIWGDGSDAFPVVTLNSNGAFQTLDVDDSAVLRTSTFQLGTGYSITLRHLGKLEVQTGGRAKAESIYVGDYDYDGQYYTTGLLNMAGGIADVSDRMINYENSSILGHGQININGASAYLYNAGLIKPDGSLSYFANNGGELRLGGRLDVTTPNANLTFSGTIDGDVESDIRIGRNGRLNLGAWTQANTATLTIGGAGASEVARLTAAGSSFKGQVIVGVATFGGTAEIAGSTTFQPSSSLLVTSGDTLKMLGGTTYRGGSMTGLGTLVQNGAAAITDSTTIAVNTYDWDGANENSVTTISPTRTLTLTSAKIESTAGDGYDGTVILQGSTLDVQTSGGWRLDGTMRFDGPNQSIVKGTPVTVAGTVTANNGSGRFEAPVELPASAVIDVHAGKSIDFLGSSTVYRGPTISGPGTLIQTGDSTVAASTVINVGTFNWDGVFTATPAMTINPGAVFTINSQQIETGDPANDGYDGTVTLNDGILTVNTAASWRMDGTMNLNDLPAPTFCAIAGNTMRLFGTMNTTGSPLVNANVEFNGGTINTAGGNALFVNPVSSAAAGTLHKLGNGTMTISSSQSYVPGSAMQIHAGTVVFGSDAGAGGANLSLQVAGRALFNTNQHLEGLTLDDGGIAVMGGGPHVLTAKSIQVAGSPGAFLGALDLADSSMLLDYTGASPLPNVTSLLRSGFAAGAWGGNGIRSSFAASNPGQSIGVADASQLGISTFMGEPVDASTLVLTHTLAGDSNLDHSVNIDDFAFLAANFNAAGSWINGDFNYDGTTDIGDFSLMAANFNKSLPVNLPRGSAVPEPAAAGLMAIVGIALGQRRRNA